MAEFKTAEQYVVAKLEMTEMELDNAQIEHRAEVRKLTATIEDLKRELDGAYELLNVFRDFLSVRKDSYWGNIIELDMIYSKHHPEEVARLMEYYDMRPEEDEDE